jgi:hypothetical protein
VTPLSKNKLEVYRYACNKIIVGGNFIATPCMTVEICVCRTHKLGRIAKLLYSVNNYFSRVSV